MFLLTTAVPVFFFFQSVSSKVAHALSEGSIPLYIIKCIFQGPPRVGKTHIKCLLLEQKLEKSASTGCAEHPERAIRRANTEKYTGTATEKWVVMDDEMLAKLIAQLAEELKSFDDIPEQKAQNGDESAENVVRTLEQKVALQSQASPNESPRELLYLIDSGGQSQFQEVLQAFIPNTTVLLLAFNLTEKLSDSPLMCYQTDESSLSFGRYALSNEEIISRFARMVYSSNKKVQVALVGTYYDQYSAIQHETIEEKDAKLLEIFSFCEKRHLLYCDLKNERLLFPVNGLQAEEGVFDDPVVCKLRSTIGSTTNNVEKVDVPLRWYALELALQKHAEKTGNQVLSMRKCMEMAASLHFKEDDVPVALKFLSDYNLIVYYDTILPDIVFTTPQVLLDKVTELTECVYKLAEKKEPEGIKQSPHRGEYLAMRDEGKVSNLIFKDFTSHYTPGLFTDEHLAKIFEHLYIISRVDDGSYFMPALLPHFSPKELENLLEDPAKPPLLFHFTDGCAPTGLFCALLVCLTSPTRGWKVHLKSKFLKGVRSNAACLQVPEMALLCIIVDSFHQFEVHYRCSAGSEKYLPKISEAVCEALEEVSHNRKYTIVFPRKSFFCRSEEHLGHDDDHPIPKRHVAVPLLSENKLRCIIDPITAYEMNPIATKWLEAVEPPQSAADNSPTIRQLTTALKTEETNWKMIGRYLYVPEWKLASIANEQSSNIDRLVAALVYWQKNPKHYYCPFSWESVVKALRDIENNELADELERKYIDN